MAHRHSDPQLWGEADSTLAEFCHTYPQIMLPTEIAKFIRNFPPLAPDLWNIVGEYATSFDEARNVGVSKIVLLRMGCLYMNGKLEAAQLLDSATHPQTITESFMYHHWGLRLFYAQRFSEAKHIFERLKQSGNDFDRAGLLNFCLCSIFIGDFEAARVALYPFHGNSDACGSGWVGMARAILSPPNTTACAFTVAQRSLQAHVIQMADDHFVRALAKNLISEGAGRNSDLRYAFNATTLQAKFGLTLDQWKANGGISRFDVLVRNAAPTLSETDLIREGKRKSKRIAGERAS
jgi:hypothetical protein